MKKTLLILLLSVSSIFADEFSPHPSPPPHYSEYPPSRPYEYHYDVSGHRDYGAKFNAWQEKGDNDAVKGEYVVFLPDGRRQIVTYRADPYSGYIADVKYEGAPHSHDEEPDRKEEYYPHHRDYTEPPTHHLHHESYDEHEESVYPSRKPPYSKHPPPRPKYKPTYPPRHYHSEPPSTPKYKHYKSADYHNDISNHHSEDYYPSKSKYKTPYKKPHYSITKPKYVTITPQYRVVPDYRAQEEKYGSSYLKYSPQSLSLGYTRPASPYSVDSYDPSTPKYSGPPQPKYSSPSPQPEYSSLSSQPEYSSPSPQPEYSNPSSQPESSTSSPQPEYSSPSSQPEYSNPSPQPEYSNPSSQPENSNPSPQPEYSDPPPPPPPEYSNPPPPLPPSYEPIELEYRQTSYNPQSISTTTTAATSESARTTSTTASSAISFQSSDDPGLGAPETNPTSRPEYGSPESRYPSEPRPSVSQFARSGGGTQYRSTRNPHFLLQPLVSSPDITYVAPKQNVPSIETVFGSPKSSRSVDQGVIFRTPEPSYAPIEVVNRNANTKTTSPDLLIVSAAPNGGVFYPGSTSLQLKPQTFSVSEVQYSTSISGFPYSTTEAPLQHSKKKVPSVVILPKIYNAASYQWPSSSDSPYRTKPAQNSTGHNLSRIK